MYISCESYAVFHRAALYRISADKSLFLKWYSFYKYEKEILENITFNKIECNKNILALFGLRKHYINKIVSWERLLKANTEVPKILMISLKEILISSCSFLLMLAEQIAKAKIKIGMVQHLSLY